MTYTKRATLIRKASIILVISFAERGRHNSNELKEKMNL
jgi:hypothetical protein